MAKYSDDMKDEKKPSKLLPAGDRVVRIAAMVEKISKAGNKMFVATLFDEQTKNEMDVFLVAEKGKRWFLKMLLSAVGIEPNDDGVFEWDTDDVVGKSVVARVEHFTEPWVNREGNEVQINKAKVTEFIEHTGNPDNAKTPSDVAWEEQ
jgi:hypothetical protein